jgi:hypothetical protein
MISMKILWVTLAGCDRRRSSGSCSASARVANIVGRRVCQPSADRQKLTIRPSTLDRITIWSIFRCAPAGLRSRSTESVKGKGLSPAARLMIDRRVSPRPLAGDVNRRGEKNVMAG